MYQHTFDVTKAFSADANILPALREAIQTTYTEGFYWGSREAELDAIVMRSDTTFTVTLNEGTTIDAALVGSEYVVEYKGNIQYIVFGSSTTLTYFWVMWHQESKTHYLAQIDVASSSTITVENGYGVNVYPTDEDGYYELKRGLYIISVTNSSYMDAEKTIEYAGQPTISVIQNAVLSSISVTTSPTKTTYIKGEAFDPAGMVVTATFADSSTEVVTDYIYSPTGAMTSVGTQAITISYTDPNGSGTQTTTTNVSVTNNLTGIAVTTPPTKTDYAAAEDFDSTGMKITATYQDGTSKVVDGWTVTNGTGLTAGQESVTISYTEGGVTKTTTQAITVS